MKQTFVFIMTILFFTSCNFSKGVKKDLNTGLTTSYNGFAVEDVYLTEGEEGKKISSNQIALGSLINVQLTGVENYVEANGKVFPGCTIILTDKAGKELLNIPDAFSSMGDGVKKEEGNNLRAKLTTGDPMVVGETYHLKCRFYDKKNTDSEIITNVDLVMK
ncbi:MAG: hypothetical protein K2X48_12645 [Chitinophagaceae bacterium]|nr:hypothetical protein [Chitinophagaceae bacterium]